MKGRTRGSVMWRNAWKALAPSTRAASRTSGFCDCRPARMISIMNGVQRQTSTVTTAAIGNWLTQPTRRATEAAVSARTPPLPATELIPVGCLVLSLADGSSESLRLRQCLIHCFTAREDLGELLRNLVAKLLEFVYVDVLDTYVRDRVDSWVGHIGVRDRLKRHVRKRAGRRLVLRQVICRSAGSWRHVLPAQLGADQLDVGLVGCPVREGPRRVLLLAAGGHAKRPRPQPTRPVLDLGRGIGVARILRRVSGEEACRHGGVVPHRHLAAVVCVEALGESGVTGPRLARSL